VTFKAYEGTKYLVLTDHVYNAGPLMVSKSRWTQVTDADREAFRGAAKEVLPYWRQEIAAAANRAAQFCKDRGMQITETDFAVFRAKMAPVYAEFEPKYPDLFDRLMAQQ
jgi:TRAP-type transport system periplasmic protein